MAAPSEMAHVSGMAVDMKRVVAQFIVDSIGRPRATSWRTITSSDAAILATARRELLERRYVPARLGEQHVCQLVMEDWGVFRTGPERPLRSP